MNEKHLPTKLTFGPHFPSHTRHAAVVHSTVARAHAKNSSMSARYSRCFGQGRPHHDSDDDHHDDNVITTIHFPEIQLAVTKNMLLLRGTIVNRTKYC